MSPAARTICVSLSGDAAGFCWPMANEQKRSIRKYVARQSKPADAAAEFVDLSGLGAFAFRKNDNAIALPHALGGIVKAFAIAGTLWQREDVKERGNQNVIQLLPPTLQEEPLLWRIAHGTKHLAGHRHGKPVAQTQR